MSSYLTNILVTLLLAILKVVCLLVAIAYFTLAERKIMAAVQRRVGPNVVGPLGLLQPLADGLKLAGKELAVPAQASSRIFLSVAISVLLFALCGWTVIPFGMFDHSESMSAKTAVKILVLTDNSVLTQVLEDERIMRAWKTVRIGAIDFNFGPALEEIRAQNANRAPQTMEEFKLETEELERELRENPLEQGNSLFNATEAFIEMIAQYHDEPGTECD